MSCPKGPSRKLFGLIPLPAKHDWRITRIDLFSWWTIYMQCARCYVTKDSWPHYDEDLQRMGLWDNDEGVPLIPQARRLHAKEER